MGMDEARVQVQIVERGVWTKLLMKREGESKITKERSREKGELV
jgi:hypothetical protein